MNSFPRSLLFVLLLALVACQPKTPPAQPTEPAQPPAEPQHHHETALPTPLAQLNDEPLDLYPDCDDALLAEDHNCSLLILYPNRLEVLHWSTNDKKVIPFHAPLLAPVRSRAPSGKIMPFRKGFLLLSNALAGPVQISADLSTDPVLMREQLDGLPLPEAGLNSFTLRNGRFWDFQFISRTSLAVVTVTGELQLGSEGKLFKADKPIGGTFWCEGDSFYASSPSQPGQPDSILRFSRQGDSIVFESERQMDSEILDLAITDLNQDQKKELLVITKNTRGIFIEVQEPF